MFQGENRSQVCFKGMSFFQLADVQMQIRPLLQICQPELVQLHVDMFIIGTTCQSKSIQLMDQSELRGVSYIVPTQWQTWQDSALVILEFQ